MMLRLWSQVARPQLSCSCVACSSSVAGVLARRTASATTRRRLKLVDAFTILLAPVLATAFVADANWKSRRSIEWDRKIAEVEGEVERLHRQESHILRSLNDGVNVRRKRIHHTRSYSTDVRSLVLEDDTNEPVDSLRWRSMVAEVHQDEDAYQTSASDAQEAFMVSPQVKEESRDAVRRIEKLVALKLAIRMVVHVNVGTSPRFIDANPGYTHDSKKPPGDLNRLIDQLRIVRRSLRQLNSARERPNVPASYKMPRNEQAVIDIEIRRSAHEFQLGKLSVRSLVTRIGNCIIRSPEPPSVKAYVPLMRAFSRARLDELAYLVMAAIDEGRLTLSNRSLFNVIWQYGKNRDAHRFDLFLDSVTKPDAATKYTETWEWRMINELELPCPTSNDSQLLQILVYTALKCNQPHRAEAWASRLKYSDTPAKHTSHVLRNFMKFYATHRDWQRGQAWLYAALDWSVSLGPDVIRDLQRVVFAILELCVACGKQDAYSCILQAAVHARVGVFRAEADLKFIERSKSILAEWDKLHSSVPTCAEDDLKSAKGKARDFSTKVTVKFEALGLTQISSRFQWPTPASADFEFPDESSQLPAASDESASEWRELCNRQAAELEKLKAQLAETEWLLSRQARLDVVERGLQASVSSPASAKTSDAPLLPASVDSASIPLAGHSVPPSSRERILPPCSNRALNVPPRFCQGTKVASLDAGQPDLDLEQKWVAKVTQVARPRPRRSQSSGLEDLIKASTSKGGLFNPNEKSKSASAPESSRLETVTEGIQAENSPYHVSELRLDSNQSNVLSELRPFTVGTKNPSQELANLQKRNGHNRKSDALDDSIERPSESPAPDPWVALPDPVGEKTDEFSTHTSAPATTTATGTPNDPAEVQVPEMSKPIRKGHWISFLKMARTRQLSAHATLRYIHLPSPEPPKAIGEPQPEGVKHRDRKPPPTITLRLSQLPSPKAVSFVNGEFKPREWHTKKAEAYVARMKARPIHNGRG